MSIANTRFRKIVHLTAVFTLLAAAFFPASWQGSVRPASAHIDAPAPQTAGEKPPQEPPAPHDDDKPGDTEVDSSFLRAPRAPVQAGLVGGTWAPQGPSPIYYGQVEGISNSEVVGAAHVVAAHPTDPNILYIGTTNGGIWRTTDAQSSSPTWVPLTDDKASLSIGALEFDPADPNLMLAGIGRYSSLSRAGGPRAGLLYSMDGGLTWIEVVGGGSGVSLIGKNVSGVAPRGPTFVLSVDYADAFTCGNIGLFRSTDGGGIFSKVGPPGTAFDLAGDPLAPGDLYSGLTYVSLCTGGSLSNGIYKSSDTGATWNKVSNPVMDALIVDGTTNNIEIAARGGIVYVNIIQNGRSAGIFYSTDGGATWTQMDLPLIPVGSTDTIANVAPGSPIGITTTANPHGLSTGDMVKIQGVTGTTGANGLHRITVTGANTFTLDGTNDSTAWGGGGTWQEVVGTNPGGQGGIHASLRVDPATPTTVYIGGDRQEGPFPNYIGATTYTGSLFRGDATVAPAGGAPSPQWDHLTHSNSVSGIPNGGTASSSAPHADSREMAIDANGDLIETDDGGIYRRTSPQNNTGDWYSLNGNLQITEIHSVAYDALSDALISGNQDNGVSYQPTSGASVWYILSGGDGGDVAVDNIALAASNQSVRYSSSQYLGWFRRTVWDASGARISTSFPALTVVGGGAALQPQFYTPIAVNEAIGDRLLIGGWNSLYESLDGGSTITEIGAGLRVNDGGNTIVYGAVGNPDALYAATGSSVAVRTSAGGSITTVSVSGAGTIRGVGMDPNNWQTVYAIDSDQVFRSTNAGASWTDVTGSLSDTNLRSIVAAPGMLFVGGGQGVYVMDTTSGTWYDFGSGLPHAPVWDLDYDDSDHVLAAGTLGRGAWTLSTDMATIQVTKTVTPTTASLGETITYTYRLTNTGSLSLTVSATDDRLGPVTLGTASLLPGAVTSGTLTYVADENDLPGPLTNTVTVTVTYTLFGGGVVTASDVATVTLTSNPALTVTKTASTASAVVGETITYTYRLTNTGDVTLSSLTATDDKLGSVSLGTASLAPGVSVSATLTHTVGEGDLPGPLVNTVTVTGTPPAGSPVSATDSASVILTSNPAIAVSKTASAASAAVGETITYTYRVTNTGDVTLSNLTATDDKLGSVTLGAASLAPGASTSAILTYTVSEGDLPGPLVNTVTVTGTPPAGAPVSATDSASVNVIPHYTIFLPLTMR